MGNVDHSIPSLTNFSLVHLLEITCDLHTIPEEYSAPSEISPFLLLSSIHEDTASTAVGNEVHQTHRNPTLSPQLRVCGKDPPEGSHRRSLQSRGLALATLKPPLTATYETHSIPLGVDANHFTPILLLMW